MLGYHKKFCLTTSKAKTNVPSEVRNCAVDHHQTICAVKTDSRAPHLQHSKTLEK